MAISDSNNPLQASSIFDLARGVETATMHLQTLFNCISQAVQDEDEAAALTLLESARHFVADVDRIGAALRAHAHRAQGTVPHGVPCAVKAEAVAANAATDEAVA